MATTVKRIKLGSQGLEVSAQGLGCMGMSAFYGPPKPETGMIAVDSGISYLDTSEMYGPHTYEMLRAKALKGGMPEKVDRTTRFGISMVGIDGDPAYVRAACEDSLKRLDVDYIDLYYQHRIDTRIPIEVTMGELKKLVEEGKIKYVGLSEASASTIRRAHAVLPITAVQVEWSLWSREVEEEIVPTCRELGIGIVAYSPVAFRPLGRGLFSSGPKLLETLSKDDSRQLSALTTQVSSLSYQVAQFGKVMESLPAQVLAKAESSIEVVNATVSAKLNELSNAKHMLASNMDYLMERVDYGIEQEGIHHIDIHGRMETMQKEIAECDDILNGFKLRAQGR